MKKSVVFGANGQDGSFLVEILSAQGHEVLGLGRQAAARYPVSSSNYRYEMVDLRDAEATREVLEGFRPDRVFHVAAVHGAYGYSYEKAWRDTLAVNVGALHVALEFARQSSARPSIIYASSAKVFGDRLTGRITERSCRHSSCLYSITKNTAESLIEYYRVIHGVSASIAFFFNHESQRRPTEFFIPTIVSALAAAIKDHTHRINVKTLDFYCDWGSASEYMEFLVEMSDLPPPGQDVIIATGRTMYGRDFVSRLFACYGLVYRRHIEQERYESEPAAIEFSASTEKLAQILGRTPRRDIFKVCQSILETEHGVKPA